MHETFRALLLRAIQFAKEIHIMPQSEMEIIRFILMCIGGTRCHWIVN